MFLFMYTYGVKNYVAALNVPIHLTILILL